jgi:hypothetical protein
MLTTSVQTNSGRLPQESSFDPTKFVKVAPESNQCLKTGTDVSGNITALKDITKAIIVKANQQQDIPPRLIDTAKELFSIIRTQLTDLQKTCTKPETKKAAADLERSVALFKMELQKVLPDHFPTDSSVQSA